MSKEEAFDQALAAKGLALDTGDREAALAVFTYLAHCRALLIAHASR